MIPTLVIAGPSAVGKTTVTDILINDGGFELVRSVTTRAPRGDGHDGEYIFIDCAEFNELYNSGGILESTEYAGNLYGTPRSEIERISAGGKTPILILDIEGVKSLSEIPDIALCAIYIYDDPCVLDKRLYERYYSALMTPASESAYKSRRVQNLIDLEAAFASEKLFYSFIRNKAPEKTASEISISLKAFREGQCRNEAEISASLVTISKFLAVTSQ